MSVFDKDLFGRSKYDLAIGRIKNFCTGKKTLVAFSGGKDSQCCYHLAKEAGIDFSAQLSITRFEPPEILEFVRRNYPDVVFRRAYKMSLAAEIELRGLPTRWMRWCCTAKHVATPGFDIAVIGVRAGESARRAATWRAFGRKPDKTAYVCPIIDWTEADVWEYLAARGVPHCCLYDEGNARIGCVCCPLAPRNMQRDAARWPKFAAALRSGAARFVARMRRAGYVTARGKPCADWCHAADPVAEYWNRWIRTGQTSKPAEAAPPDDSDQQCLFAGTGFSETDGEDAPPWLGSVDN